LMNRFGMDGEPIEHKLVTRGIESAQKRVEAHNFDIRKHLLEYDNVMNKQREVIYARRREVLQGNLREDILEMIETQATELVERLTDAETGYEDWNVKELAEALHHQYGVRFQWSDEFLEGMTQAGLAEHVVGELRQVYERKEREFESDRMRYLERMILLSNLDNMWKDHLLGMDHLKEGIGLRGYAQQDPLRAYQKEGYEMFQELMRRIEESSVRQLFHVQMVREDTELESLSKEREQELVFSHSGGGSPKPAARKGVKVGRNEPCPCGSGKKFKKCCGR